MAKRAATSYASNLMGRHSHAIQHRTEVGVACAVCVCGWRTTAPTYGQRREDIYRHLDVTRAAAATGAKED